MCAGWHCLDMGDPGSACVWSATKALPSRCAFASCPRPLPGRPQLPSAPAPSAISPTFLSLFSNVQVWVYGDSHQSCLVGVVVPSHKGLMVWAANNGVSGEYEEVLRSPAARAAVLAAMTATGKAEKLNSLEQVKAITLTPEQVWRGGQQQRLGTDRGAAGRAGWLAPLRSIPCLTRCAAPLRSCGQTFYMSCPVLLLSYFCPGPPYAVHGGERPDDALLQAQARAAAEALPQAGGRHVRRAGGGGSRQEEGGRSAGVVSEGCGGLVIEAQAAAWGRTRTGIGYMVQDVDMCRGQYLKFRHALV